MISVSGVISGGYPSSARTWTTSASTSARRPRAVALAKLGNGVAHRGGRQQSAQRRGVETGRERIDDVRVLDQLLFEHQRGGGDTLEVETGIDLGPGEPRHQRLGAGHRCTAGERRKRAVGAIRSRDRGSVARQCGHSRLRRDRTAAGTPAASRTTFTAFAAAAAPGRRADRAGRSSGTRHRRAFEPRPRGRRGRARAPRCRR